MVLYLIFLNEIIYSSNKGVAFIFFLTSITLHTKISQLFAEK